jgi:hypothetical protein
MPPPPAPPASQDRQGSAPSKNHHTRPRRRNRRMAARFAGTCTLQLPSQPTVPPHDAPARASSSVFEPLRASSRGTTRWMTPPQRHHRLHTTAPPRCSAPRSRRTSRQYIPRQPGYASTHARQRPPSLVAGSAKGLATSVLTPRAHLVIDVDGGRLAKRSCDARDEDQRVPAVDRMPPFDRTNHAPKIRIARGSAPAWTSGDSARMDFAAI